MLIKFALFSTSDATVTSATYVYSKIVFRVIITWLCDCWISCSSHGRAASVSAASVYDTWMRVFATQLPHFICCWLSYPRRKRTAARM